MLVREGVASSLGSKDVADLQRGDVLSLRLSGAGGFGPRSQRSHAAVCDDVADGYVSVEGARDDYGVEVMPDGRIK
jgi:N-methylhydantoinase B